MKTIIKLLAPMAIGAGVVALVQKLRENRGQRVGGQDVGTEDSFSEPVIVAEEIVVVTDDDFDDLVSVPSEGISGT